MKSNGGLEQQLTNVLKSIVRQVKESQENCKEEGPQVYKHHRLAAKNIQLNLVQVERFLGENKTLLALHDQARKELSKLNHMIRDDGSQNTKQIKPLKERFQSPDKVQQQTYLAQLKILQKKYRIMELEVQTLKDTVCELTHEKSKLLHQIHELESDAVMTAANLASLSQRFSEEQVIHQRKRSLIVEEIEQLRNRLGDTLKRNETLVRENNQLQTDRHQLMQLQLEYRQKFDELLRRVDGQIAELQQKVQLEKLNTERSQERCEQLQRSMDDAYSKLQRSQSQVQVLLDYNDIENRQKMKQQQTTRSQQLLCEKQNLRLRSLNDLRLELALLKHALD